MSSNNDPNFPLGLDIHPLASSTTDADTRFDSTAQEGAIKTYGIAGRIWEASHALLAYLDPSSEDTLAVEFEPPSPFRDVMCSEFNKRVSTAHQSSAPCHPIVAVELGSGTGFVAARIAQWLRPGSDVLVATDLPDVCPLLETNLRACRAVRVRALPWGSCEHARKVLEELSCPRVGMQWPRLTHIFCSDLIYFPALLAPLLRSLIDLTNPPFAADNTWQPASVIISYKIRSLAKETPFWNAFGLWFEYSPVLVRKKRRRSEHTAGDTVEEEFSRFSPGDLADEMFVLVANRRPESLVWRVPEADAALLGGVGAHGTDSSKSDDQFEQLLLMSVEF